MKKYTIKKDHIIINATGEKVYDSHPDYTAIRKAALRLYAKRLNRNMFDMAMRDLGLTKVRGAVSGRIYWE